ncbi:hypothetical protein F4778DRAFT_741417 [Xylariomycetidae sp. FL2044]|nr:hypothetical protein F4778DRAFT_741417 [Xylariomycetidae sp. FL2044]
MADLTQTYEAIQKWAGHQLRFAAEHGQPAPLTKEQSEALKRLEAAIRPTFTEAEPEIGDENWVGLLVEFEQSRRSATGESVDIQYVEGGENLAWFYLVNLDKFGVLFPCSKYGVKPDGSLPTFVRKKDAKQYASKWAVHWLREKGYIPQDGGVKFPQDGGVKSPQAKVSPVQSPPPPPAKSPFDDGPSATIEVEQLCRELNIRSHKYHIDPNPDDPRYFSGYFATPDVDSPLFPSSLTLVEDLIGKKAAKERIAEKARDQLRKLKEQRLKAVGL